jgi:hypothetical protein
LAFGQGHERNEGKDCISINKTLHISINKTLYISQQCRSKTKCQKDQGNAHYRARKSRSSINKNKWNRFGKGN